MRTYTKRVGAIVAARIVRELVELSVWFEVTPMPDAAFDVTVKLEDGGLLRSRAAARTWDGD